MVDETQPEQNNPELKRSLEKSGVDVDNKKSRDKGPFYRVIGSTKIPVTKKYGPLWKSRRDAARAARKSNDIEQAWDEALKYFDNDQMRHRDDNDPDTPGNESVARKRNRRFSETENIVFANTRAMVPVTYARNPRVEFTTEVKGEGEDIDSARQFATLVERVVNAIIAKPAAPGVNLKPKARRCVVMTTLTNKSWLEVGYTFREQSSDEALKQISTLAERLSKAKTTREITEIEGELMAAEKKIDVLQPAGPWVKFRRPHDVLVDPDAIEEDGSDANWMMVADFLATEFINAVYAERDKTGRLVSAYNPTHVLKSEGADTSVDEQVNNFSLIPDSADWKRMGFEDDESFRRAQRTKVWWIWDKVTRRVFLYSDGDWTWPIWVWDDPYNLDRFYPLFPLSFYTNPIGGDSKGEVTYYLDQQDAVNEINDEERRVRLQLKRAPFFNKNVISPEDMQRWLAGATLKAVGVDIPEGQKLTDHIWAAPWPSVNFPQVFDVERKLRAVDRIGAATDVIRGVQFKTNTTNRAIDSYEATTNTILDERIDAVEDLIGNIGWALAQLALQFMGKEQVATLVGEALAAGWKNLSPQEVRTALSVRVVGGSTAKPTSKAKKREAIEVGQVLGQFASVAPAALEIALRAFEQAFDEIVISEEDWRFIRESTQQQLQRGNSIGTGPTTGMQANANNAGQVVAQLSQFIDSLPQQARQALGTAVARGVPVRQALEQIVAAIPQQSNTNGAQRGEDNVSTNAAQ